MGYIILFEGHGFYKGRLQWRGGVPYPSSAMSWDDNRIKIYSSKKRAINSAEKVKQNSMGNPDYTIIPIYDIPCENCGRIGVVIFLGKKICRNCGWEEDDVQD